MQTLSSPKEKRKRLIWNDVVKAYDNVNQDRLKELANSELHKGWIELIDNYNALNYQIGTNVIKREKGIPQGAKLAPILYNFYADRALEDISLDDTYIYADNIAVIGTNRSALMLKAMDIKLHLQEFGLNIGHWDWMQFTGSKLKASETDSTNADRINSTIKLPADFKEENSEPKRVLGFNLSVYKDLIQIDERDIKIPKALSLQPPYKAMNLYKQKVEPKFAFQMKHTDADYKPLRTKLLKEMMAMIKIPSGYYEANFLAEYSYWAKFYSLFTFEKLKKDRTADWPPNHNELHFERWKALCALMKSYYLPYYQIVKFIYLGRARLIRAKMNAAAVKHNAKALDYLYFALVQDWNFEMTYGQLQMKLLKEIEKKLIKKKFILEVNFPEKVFFK
jgi:hypothetical protein